MRTMILAAFAVTGTLAGKQSIHEGAQIDHSRFPQGNGYQGPDSRTTTRAPLFAGPTDDGPQLPAQQRMSAGTEISTAHNWLCPGTFQAGYVTGVGEHRSPEALSPAACAQYAADRGAKGWSMSLAALNDQSSSTRDFCHYYMCGFDTEDATQLTTTDDDYYYEGNTYAFCDRQGDSETLPPSPPGDLNFGSRNDLCAGGFKMGYPDVSNEYYIPTGIMTPVECAAAVAQWPEVTGWSMMDYELKSGCGEAAGWCYYFLDSFDADSEEQILDDYVGPQGQKYAFCDLQLATPAVTSSPTPSPTLADGANCPAGYKFDANTRYNWGLGAIRIVHTHQQCADRCTQFAGVQYNGGCKGFQTGMYFGNLMCRSYGGNFKTTPCAPWAKPDSAGYQSGVIGDMAPDTGQANIGGSCCVRE